MYLVTDFNLIQNSQVGIYFAFEPKKQFFFFIGSKERFVTQQGDIKVSARFNVVSDSKL
jgi:hypothetical protein